MQAISTNGARGAPQNHLSRQAAFIAARARVSPSLAAVLAEHAFGEPRGDLGRHAPVAARLSIGEAHHG